MNYVREIAPDTFERLSGNPTLLSSDGTERAPLKTMIHLGAKYAARYAVHFVPEFVCPAGHQLAGNRRYEREAGAVVEIYDVTAIPAGEQGSAVPTVGKSEIINRLTDAQLNAFVTGMNLRQRELWRSPDVPRVPITNPQLRALIEATGADVEFVLSGRVGTLP